METAPEVPDLRLPRDAPAERPGAAGRLSLGASRIRALALPERVVYGSALLYGALFALLATAYHLAFQTARYDLGTMVQAVWNTLHGHFLEGTTQAGDQAIRLEVHVDPFLVLLVPLYWLWSSPLVLVVVQALAVAAGALPVYWLARKHLGQGRVAVFWAFAYLVFPATQFNAFATSTDTGFHPVSIAVPLLLFAIWFLDEDRPLAFAVVALLAASTKEEIPAAVGFLGLWYAVRSRRWAFGLSVFVVGLAGTVVDFLVVMPHFLGSATFFGGQYAAVGGSPSGIVRTAFTDPGAIAGEVLSVHKLVWVVLLFGPFLGLWLREPLLLLAAAPDFLIDILSGWSGPTSIAYHYTAGIVPALVAASILGAARRRRHAARVSFYVLAATAVVGVYSPVVAGLQHAGEALPGNAVHRAKAEAISLVPAGVPVSASNQLGGHLSERRRVMLYPFAVREARWIVVDEADPTYGDGVAYRRRIERLGRDPAWRRVYSSHGVLVFHRTDSGSSRKAGSG